MGATISGINPALFASYTGAITTVYSTGWLEFTFFLSLVFALGVASGISTWFFILIALLEKYKKVRPGLSPLIDHSDVLIEVKESNDTKNNAWHGTFSNPAWDRMRQVFVQLFL